MINFSSLLFFYIGCSSDNTIKIYKEPPIVSIQTPSEEAELLVGVTYSLRGIVTDNKFRNDLSVLDILWTANSEIICEDGTIDAMGNIMCVHSFSIAGPTDLELVATNPDGETASSVIQIELLPNSNPYLAIQQPRENGIYFMDYEIPFEAYVTDNESNYDQLFVKWTSSIDGNLPIEDNVQANNLNVGSLFLNEGTHVITATATDDYGMESTTSVTIEVGPPNAIPTCQITAPQGDSVFPQDGTISLQGFANDANIDPTDLIIKWYSQHDGILGISTANSTGMTSLDVTGLSPNTHEITLEVTDDLGAVCTDMTEIIIGIGPSVQIITPTQSQVFNEDATVPFLAEIVDQEDAPEDLIVRWYSSLDGLLSTASPDANGQSSTYGFSMTPGEHVIRLEVTDTDNFSSEDTVDIVINDLPSVPGITLSPQPTTSSDNIVIGITQPSTDLEGDALTYQYQWTKNGVTYPQYFPTIPYTETTRDDVWEVTVRAFDGFGYGDPTSIATVIQNSKPILNSANISPQTLFENTVVECVHPSPTDIDQDVISLHYEWHVNGVNSGHNQSTIEGSLFNRDDVLQCYITPNDGIENGTTVSSGTIVVQSTPPVLDEVTLEPIGAITSDTLECILGNYYDVDGDNVDFTYNWFVQTNGTVSTITLNDAELPPSFFARADKVWCEVTPDDGSVTGNAITSNTLTIQNAIPEISAVALSPQNPKETSLLTCAYVSYSDDDNDNITFTYNWFVNGSPLGLNSNTIDGQYFDRDQAVYCTMTPNDGLTNGATVASNQVTIQNTIPVIPTVQLTPDPGFEDSTLYCTQSGANDNDGDIITHTYEWFINNIPQSIDSPTLDGSTFNKNESVSCMMTPNDGTSDGLSVMSNVIDIENTSPYIVSVSVTPTDATETTTLQCTPNGGMDIDNDDIEYSFAWYIDGVFSGVTSDTIDGNNFDKLEVVVCHVTPYDVNSTGGKISDGNEVISNSITIKNTSPSIQSAILAPADAYENTMLYCSPVGVNDVDGDVLKYTYQWFVSTNGNFTNIGVSTSSIDGSRFNKNNDIYCTITPYDTNIIGAKVSDGNTVSSDIVSIQNSSPTLTSVSVSPTMVQVDDTLNCTPNGGNDLDGDPIDYEVTWIVNNVDIGVSTNTLTSDNFQKGESIKCKVVPFDTDASGNKISDGSVYFSNSVSVDNSPPEMTGAIISPSDAFEDTTITCTPQGGTDADGDPIEFSYLWFVNGTSTGVTSDTITGTHFNKNQSVYCQITPYDLSTLGIKISDGQSVTSSSINIQNTPPTVANISVSPSSAYKSSTLTCVVGTKQDIDSDQIDFDYDWFVDGANIGVNASTLSNSNFNKNQSVSCKVTPYDLTVSGQKLEEGSQVGSSDITILNTSPSLDSASLTPSNPDQNDVLTCSPGNTTDIDGDSVIYEYAWIVAGNTISVTTNTLTNSHFSKGENVQCKITPYDIFEGNAISAGNPVLSNVVTVVNTSPTVGSVTITPSNAYENTTLTCNPLGGTDLDGDAIGYSYIWFVDGNNTGVTSQTIDGSNFDKNQNVKCRVTPFDNNSSGTKISDGPSVDSNTITILNTPPVISSVGISPTTAYESSTLICSVGGTSDIDGDNVGYNYSWTVNGGDAGITTNTLTGSSFSKNDSVICIVTPFDKTTSGALLSEGNALSSSPLTIKNSPPSFSSVEIDPSNAYTETDLSAVMGGFSDIDGDAEGYTYEWLINGSVVSTDPVLSHSFTKKGDSVRARVSPFDGTNGGSSIVSNAITILNTLPGAPVVQISPQGAEPYDDILCDIVTQSFDPDNDNITYHIVWFADGVEQLALEDVDLVDSIYTNNGETWKCVVTPNDGGGNGAVAQAFQNVADVTAPNTPVFDAMEEYYNEGSVTITGLTEANAEVTINTSALDDSECNITPATAFVTADSNGAFSFTFQLAPGSRCSYSAFAVDAYGNVSPSSNEVETEICLVPDEFEDATTYGDSCGEPVDEFIILADNATETEIFNGNIISSTDSDWYLIQTVQSTLAGNGSGNNVYDFTAQLTEGQDSYDIRVFRGNCGDPVNTSVGAGDKHLNPKGEQCIGDSYDSYTFFAQDKGEGSSHVTPSDTRYCSENTKHNACFDFSSIYYIQVVRVDGMLDCTHYTLELSNN